MVATTRTVALLYALYVAIQSCLVGYSALAVVPRRVGSGGSRRPF